MIAWVSLTVNPPTEVVLMPVEQLMGSVERVRLLTSTKQEKPATAVVLTGVRPNKPEIEVIDFTVERQELTIGIQSPDESPAWKTISLEAAAKVLEETASQQPDTLARGQSNPVFTMPLPAIVGAWPKSVVHPKLKDDQQLFRFIDFTVRPGHHYRYRVRLECINPNYRKNPDPFVSSGATRLSPWSMPCSTVTVTP